MSTRFSTCPPKQDLLHLEESLSGLSPILLGTETLRNKREINICCSDELLQDLNTNQNEAELKDSEDHDMVYGSIQDK